MAKRVDLRPLPALRGPRRGRRGAQPGGPARLARGDRRLGPRRLRPDGDRPAHRPPAGRRRRAPARWAARCPASPSRSTTASSSCTTRAPTRRSSCATSARPAPHGVLAHRRPRHADEDGYLFFEGRTDDVIISAGYRIGPFEVESALVAHEAVAEAAVVAAPDDERGSVVRAVVVLRDGFARLRRARRRASGPRQGRHRAVQVPAHRRLRRRAAQDHVGQGPARPPSRAGVTSRARPSR